MSSFDIVCVVEIQEVNNAVDQARREINNRYDFRNSNCEIDFDKNKPALKITADDEFKMQTTIDILLTKLVKREVPVKSPKPIALKKINKKDLIYMKSKLINISSSIIRKFW